MPFKVSNTLPGPVAALIFFLLWAQGPLSAQSYLDWYANAQERIDTLRKGTFHIQVHDRHGEPWTGPVSVRMKKHEFPFGAAFDLYEDIERWSDDPDVFRVASQEEWMRAAALKYFNFGVNGNSFKWSGIQPRPTAPDYANFDNLVKWYQKVGWEFRAHTLLWGGDDDHSMPGWVRELPGPEAITDACEMRVTREVSRYRGIVKEYDVINEPLTGHADHLRKTVGDSILWNCFKWAREADPDAELYINDYNVEYNWGQAEEYRDLILRLKAKGAPVNGVGIQAHFWDCCRPNVGELVKNLNIVAEAGLPMRLTEYDFGTNLSQAQQAADMIMVMTIAFSHPAINGMIFWSMSDNGSWRPGAGLFDEQNRAKLAADSLLYYTRTKWATNFDRELAAGEGLSFEAYFGDYEIEVPFGDTVKVFSISCKQAIEGSTFVLNEASARLRPPRLTATELLGNDRVLLDFDMDLDTATAFRGDFRFYSNTRIGISAIEPVAGEPKQLLVSLSKGVNEGEYLAISYYPGRLKGADGSWVEVFGPEEIENTIVLPDPDIVLDKNGVEQFQFSYGQGFGPSLSVSFRISGTEMQGDIQLSATTGYEMSLSPEEGFSSQLILLQSEGLVPEATIYVRLAGELSYGDHFGKILISSPYADDHTVTLNGTIGPPPALSLSGTELAGMDYAQGEGPSEPVELLVSGMWLFDELELELTGDFELSLSGESGYGAGLPLIPEGEYLEETVVYVRLSPGLEAGSYQGVIQLSIAEEELAQVLLTGEVGQPTGSGSRGAGQARVVAREYFNLSGQPCTDPGERTGIYIERIHYSDGRIEHHKILRTRSLLK